MPIAIIVSKRRKGHPRQGSWPLHTKTNIKNKNCVLEIFWKEYLTSSTTYFFCINLLLLPRSFFSLPHSRIPMRYELHSENKWHSLKLDQDSLRCAPRLEPLVLNYLHLWFVFQRLILKIRNKVFADDTTI